MIAVDTNILVYAHRPEAPLHSAALAAMDRLHIDGAPWGIPIHCLVEFAAVVSNPRIWQQPSSQREISEQTDVWTTGRGFRHLGDDPVVWGRTVELASAGAIQGAGWYDARIAGVCLAHRVRELWTLDRDYSRFPALKTHNPLIG